MRLRHTHRNKHYVDCQNGYANYSGHHSAHQKKIKGVIRCEQTFKYTTRRGLDEIPQMLIALITSHCNYIRICTLVYCVIIFSNYTQRFSINYTGRVSVTNKSRPEIIYVNLLRSRSLECRRDSFLWFNTWSFGCTVTLEKLRHVKHVLELKNVPSCVGVSYHKETHDSLNVHKK